jgi:hypothetical protein
VIVRPADPLPPARAPGSRVRSIPPHGWARTDGEGRATLAVRKGARLRFGITAPTFRPIELSAIPGDGVVRLLPASTLAVRVVGLPADAPRVRLRVLLRHVERARLDLCTDAAVGEGDVARVPRPVSGSYRVLLLVTPEGAKGLSGTTVAHGPTEFAIGDGEVAPYEIVLDDGARARVRTMLAK